jgi:hypothetical protein
MPFIPFRMYLQTLLGGGGTYDYGTKNYCALCYIQAQNWLSHTS